ncbi:MAG: 8-oxo-dGTP diphosphatase [Kiritimatiellia bacterium]
MRVVAGAIVRGDQVLVAQRSQRMKLPGCWELPGGKVETGESDAVALARELHEELGVSVEVGDLLGESSLPPLHLVAYVCTLIEGQLTAHEHSALRWMHADELHELGWAPADIPLLDDVAAWLRRHSPS